MQFSCSPPEETFFLLAHVVQRGLLFCTIAVYVSLRPVIQDTFEFGVDGRRWRHPTAGLGLVDDVDHLHALNAGLAGDYEPLGFRTTVRRHEVLAGDDLAGGGDVGHLLTSPSVLLGRRLFRQQSFPNRVLLGPHQDVDVVQGLQKMREKASIMSETFDSSWGFGYTWCTEAC